jgi:hypothetical protein
VLEQVLAVQSGGKDCGESNGRMSLMFFIYFNTIGRDNAAVAAPASGMPAQHT